MTKMFGERRHILDDQRKQLLRLLIRDRIFQTHRLPLCPQAMDFPSGMDDRCAHLALGSWHLALWWCALHQAMESSKRVAYRRAPFGSWLLALGSAPYPPAIAGTMLISSLSFTGRRFVLQEADVFVVDEDIDETADVALVVADALFEAGKGLFKMIDHFADVDAGGRDDFELVGEFAEGSRDADAGHEVYSVWDFSTVAREAPSWL